MGFLDVFRQRSFWVDDRPLATASAPAEKTIRVPNGFAAPADGMKTALSPDGLPVVQFGSDISRVLRLGGVGWNYAQIYANQQNVRTVIDYVARQAAGLRLKMYEKVPRSLDKPDGRLELDENPFQNFLDDPTPGQARFDWYYALFADLLIYDEAKFIIVRASRSTAPGALVRVPPPNLMPNRDPRDGTLLNWKNMRGEAVRKEDVVWFGGYDPGSLDGAIPPMETLRRLLSEEYARDKFRDYMWNKALRKDGVIEQDKDAAPMSDEARESFLLDAEDALAGATGSYRPFMLEPGMSYKDITFSPRDMEYIASRRVSRQEAAAMWHVPPQLIAAAENGSQPDESALKVFYQSTLPPYLERVESNFKAKVLPLFTPSDTVRRRQYVRFNLDEKLRGSFEERAAIMATLAGGPIVTVNEARARIDMPATGEEEDDLIYAPSNSTRGGGPQASPQNPTDTPAQGVNPAGTTPTPAPSNSPKRDVWEESYETLKNDPERALILDSMRKARSKSRAEQERFLVAKRATFEERGRVLMERTFERQQNSTKSKGFNRERFDRELRDDLFGHLYQSVGTVGDGISKMAGFDFNHERTAEFLKKHAELVAQDVNAKTAELIADDKTDQAFSPERAGVVAAGLATFSVAFGTHEVATQATFSNEDIKMNKTWITGGPNSRPSHAAMSGETVPVNEPFSNGLMFPGDASTGDAAEVANCTCVMTVE